MRVEINSNKFNENFGLIAAIDGYILPNAEVKAVKEINYILNNYSFISLPIFYKVESTFLYSTRNINNFKDQVGCIYIDKQFVLGKYNIKYLNVKLLYNILNMFKKRVESLSNNLR